MSALFTLILIASLIVMFVTSIWMLIEAFSESILWGLAYLFIPFAAIVFVFVHWERAKTPFLIGLAALVPYTFATLAIS